MAITLTNFGRTTLNGSLDNVVTAVIVTSGAVFPSTGDFYVRVEDEIMKCTSRSTNTLTVVRGADGSSAVSHSSGLDIKEVASAEFFKRLGSVLHPNDTHANRPAAATVNEGQIHTFSDSYQIERSTGSLWTPYGPIWQFTAPDDSQFAWINQGTATLETTFGGIYLLSVATAGSNLRIRKKTAPATPYTITAGFIPSMPATAGVFPGMGLLFRESATSKIITGSWTSENDPASTPIVRANFQKWTNATTFSANYGTQTFQNVLQLVLGPIIWYRLANDGTTLTFSVSNDGRHFFTIKAAAKADFFTTAPDEIGFWTNSNSTTSDAGLLLLSWTEA